MIPVLRSMPSRGLTVWLPPATQGQRGAEELLSWLMRYKLFAQRAACIIHRSGVRSLPALALHLRFALPPLWLATKECVCGDMRALFGVGKHQAFEMLAELGVTGAPTCCSSG
jgi:hypothetical protein